MSNPFVKSLLNTGTFHLKFRTKSEVLERLFLPAIIESYSRVKLVSGVHNFKENDIRNEFIRDFRERNSLLKSWLDNKIIWLGAENQACTDDYSKRTDIELKCTFHEIYFVIECKRLASFETRYIQGRNINGVYEPDGLEKFLKLFYSSKEAEAAMVGFIVNGSAQQIFLKTKDAAKIFEPSPQMSLVINKSCANWQMSFQSSHIRSDKSSILLYHLFFDFQESSLQNQ